METAQPKKLGKYTLLKHLATGGMAEIWLAEQEMAGGIQRQVVVKQILPHMARDTQFTQMFLDEARTVMQLTHPNIAQIYELGEIDGNYFISMEYVDGLDLADLVTESAACGQPIPISLAVRIVADMLQGLEFAHNLSDKDGSHVGLVHRDVTPHNIIVSNDGVVKLLDFGVAKAKANSSKTETGAVKGKYAYMAPEQIESKELDRRVDVFAAGIVLYEVLTGSRPFGDDLAAINGILLQPTPDPRIKRPDVPQSLVNILEVALAKDRAQRYASAEMMMHDLEDFLRASGAFVGQRDISSFVRGLRGLAPMSTSTTPSALGPRARITQQESVVSGPQSQAPRNFTAQIPSTMPADPTMSVPTGGGGSGKFIIIFGLVMIAILGAVGVIGVLIYTAEDKGKDKPVVIKKDPKIVAVKGDMGASTKPDMKPDTKPDMKPDVKVEAKPNSKALFNAGGEKVTIKSEQELKIYHKGVYVGDTPFATYLYTGDYTITLKLGAREQELTFTVKQKSPNVVMAKIE
jgi:eukaryotic-like serine/threonine-protein kinase